MNGIDTDVFCHFSEVSKCLLVIGGVKTFLLVVTGCHDF